MKFSKIKAVLILVGLFPVASCAPPGEQKAEFIVFGTVMEVTTWGASEQQAQTAFFELQTLFQQMHRDWHAWEPGRLTTINEAFAEGESALADKDILQLVSRSRELEKRSGGRFNPAIGGLVRLWGFHTSDFPILGPPPSQADIQSILDLRPSTLDIKADGFRMESSNPSVQLDFGGIAKGFAIDLACARLRELGINNAIVNAGGDLRAFGQRGSRPWRVGIRNPAGGIIGGVTAEGDEAIFTSGVYERFRLDQQERYPHILDPRTGWPVEGIAAVTVISAEGLLADAAATAIIVAGQEDWISVAHSMGLDKVMLVEESGTVYLTPELSGRVEFVEGVKRVIVDIIPEP